MGITADFDQVFSEFEILEQYIKFPKSENYESMSSVGSSTEELEVKIVTKNCQGVVAKRKTRGTGNGTLTQSIHVPATIYNKMYAMGRKTLATGVYAYGQNSNHPVFSITQKVADEDGNIKYKAYPKCILESGPKRPITNGQTEVPELELTISFSPDEYGEGMYEAFANEVTEDIATKWLQDFTRELVQLKEI